MRGKRPKERKSYVLRVNDGTLVEVTREVYLEWYQSRRREKYQMERKQKFGVCSLDEMQEQGHYPVPAEGHTDNEPEENPSREDCLQKLRKSLEMLPEQDAYLIYLLFFENVTVKEAAQICGCSRKTIQNRRNRILAELKNTMKELGITNNCFLSP
jgi:RNA polymerase sigma factor (sigma-70 family)